MFGRQGCVVHRSIGIEAQAPNNPILQLQISCRDFDKSLSQVKSLTPTVYARVGDLFRQRFGDHAGWAHSILFAAELPFFRAKLDPSIVAEMEAARLAEKALKGVVRRHHLFSNSGGRVMKPWLSPFVLEC